MTRGATIPTLDDGKKTTERGGGEEEERTGAASPGMEITKNENPYSGLSGL
jgi:hypothetical protein